MKSANITGCINVDKQKKTLEVLIDFFNGKNNKTDVTNNDMNILCYL